MTTTETALIERIQELESRIIDYIATTQTAERRLRALELKFYGLMCGIAGAIFIALLLGGAK